MRPHPHPWSTRSGGDEQIGKGVGTEEDGGRGAWIWREAAAAEVGGGGGGCGGAAGSEEGCEGGRGRGWERGWL